MKVPPHPGLDEDTVYLDHNATTPVDPRVAEAMGPWLTTGFGNPSSGHAWAAERRSATACTRAWPGRCPAGSTSTGPSATACPPR
ncbi:hypothetical protein [Actinacidiphila glaucinigra]